jgi:hypothetical protein
MKTLSLELLGLVIDREQLEKKAAKLAQEFYEMIQPNIGQDAIVEMVLSDDNIKWWLSHPYFKGLVVSTLYSYIESLDNSLNSKEFYIEWVDGWDYKSIKWVSADYITAEDFEVRYKDYLSSVTENIIKLFHSPIDYKLWTSCKSSNHIYFKKELPLKVFTQPKNDPVFELNKHETIPLLQRVLDGITIDLQNQGINAMIKLKDHVPYNDIEIVFVCSFNKETKEDE